jgi:Reverse transcriptase (RNA-dependent DNA polymerase)
MPKSTVKAYAMDCHNGSKLWTNAIAKEMLNVRPAFKFVDDDKIPEFWKHVGVHMIFDVKMDLTQKARLVANGHETEVPTESTYSTVVTRDSVRLAFMLAVLNCLDVLSGDVQNVYINAESKENLYIKEAGPEFGPGFMGRPCMIVRALYRLKSSRACWHDHMAQMLRDMGYVTCVADHNVWMKAKVKPTSDEYWEYFLIYSDNIPVMLHEPQMVMQGLMKAYMPKEGSVVKPKTYLGADVAEHIFSDDVDPETIQWSLSSDMYIKRAIADVEQHLSDIVMSSYMAAPCEGHLEQLLHIFGYLKSHDSSRLVFDNTTPYFDESRFTKCDWSEYYPGAVDLLPPNMPQPQGKLVMVLCYVDADHAGCQVTHCSHTGILILVNCAPILWLSKRQNMSTFGSEEQRICFHQTRHSHEENQSWSCAMLMLTMLDAK